MRLRERTGQDYVTPDVRQKITDFARKGGMLSDSPIQVESVDNPCPGTESTTQRKRYVAYTISSLSPFGCA